MPRCNCAIHQQYRSDRRAARAQWFARLRVRIFGRSKTDVFGSDGRPS